MALRKVLYPAKSNSFLKQLQQADGSPRIAHISPVNNRRSAQSNVLKNLTDLEEYLEEAYPLSFFSESKDPDDKFWQDIRQKLLQVVELTHQTSQFHECCGKDVKHSRCPFTRTSHRNVQTTTLSPCMQPHYYRRGSSPVPTSPRRHTVQREILVSYGGFESIMNSYSSDLAMDDANDQVWSDVDTTEQSTFRRDLRAPVRRKKHASHSSSCAFENTHHHLLHVQEM